MAIDIHELPGQQSSSLDKDGKRKHRRVFQAVTDDKYDNTWTVSAATSIIVGIDIDTPYVNDAGAVCIGISSRSTENFKYEVAYDFESFTAADDPDPFNRPTKYSWSFDKKPQSVDQTVTGDAIVNSAGDVFAEAIQRDVSTLIFTVSRTETRFDAELAWSMIDTVNAETWQNAAAGTVRCRNINSDSEENERLGTLYNTKYVFEVNPNQFDISVLDQGYRELDEEMDLVPVKLNGQPVQQPVLLDGSGQQLPQGGTPVFLTFKVNPDASFDIFNL